MQSLQSQLSALQQKQKTAPKLPYGAQCSLLFDFKFANQIELDTIYEIGYEGLLELSRKDETFIKYLKLLFSSTSKYFNRDMIPSNEIKNYDDHLKHLLYDLSKYFDMRAAHQVIEYLIKVYQVNLHLCDELVFSFLCYHSQPVFTKLLQNVNFNEHSAWNFIELFAKNGTVIPKSVVSSYANTDFAFLLRLMSFYIENIEISNEAYYAFMLEVVKSKVETMNSVKAVEVNLFQLIVKLINKIHNGYSKVGMNKEERYSLAYLDCVKPLLTKVNFSAEYLQAIANDSMANVLAIIESANSMIGMIGYHSALSIKYAQLNAKANSKLYSIDSLKLIDKKADLLLSVHKQLINEKDIEYFIYELIISGDTNFSLIKPLLVAFFQDQSTIEQVILLLMKYNQTAHWSLIEDLNLTLFNKAFINLYKQKLITTAIQTRTNYGVYFDLISSSVAQVLKAIRECDEEMGMDIDESIKTALRSKFDFFDEEVILNSVLEMKRLEMEDLNDSLLQFYCHIKRGRVNKYSETFMTSIQKRLDKTALNSNQLYYLYRTIFFKEEDTRKKKTKHSVPLITFIEFLIEIIDYQPECNPQLNQKRTIEYLNDQLTSSIDLTLTQCNSIQALLNSKRLPLYPQMQTSLYHFYLSAISKAKLLFEVKLPLIAGMASYAIDNPTQFTSKDLDELFNVPFGENRSSKQLCLAYLLFDLKNNSKKFLEYTYSTLHAEKEIECLLLIALMMHLPSLSNEQFAFYFNPKGKAKINFSSFSQMTTSSKARAKENKWLTAHREQSTKSISSLMTLINLYKSEISVNKKYLSRIFSSASIEHEALYLLLLHLLLTQYNPCYHKASIEVFALFTKPIEFDKEHLQSLLSFIQSVSNDYELECLLLRQFMLFYPQSQFELMEFFNTKRLPTELIDIFFENGAINEIKTPQMLIQLLSFAVSNNLSPYTLNISLPPEQLVQYLNYIIKNPIEENQLVFFFKLILLAKKSCTADLIEKAIEIIKSQRGNDININLCYVLYSLSKQLTKAKAPNNTSHIIKSISSLFKTLCDSITLSNAINYEQEKKIQLLLATSNHLSSIASMDNNTLIELAEYVESSDSLGLSLKKEISAIILEALIDFLNATKQQTPEFYFKYIKCLIDYSDMTGPFLKQFSSCAIMSIPQCQAYFSYHLYRKYSSNERNEVLTRFILSADEHFKGMLEWMKLIEEVINLKETKGKTVKELIGYIIAFVLKISNWNERDEAKDKATCTVQLNISTLLYDKANDLIDKLLLFAKKNKLLPSLLMTLYSPNEEMAINYSKAKHFLLSKLTQSIPMESTDNHSSLLSFILRKVVIEGKEKKFENLCCFFQLLARICNKHTSIDVLKESLKPIISKIAFDKSDLSKIVYSLTICKWLLTVFNLFTMNFLTQLNVFLPSFIAVLKGAFTFCFNKDVKSLLIESMQLLSQGVCPYLSPFLNDLIEALIRYEDIDETKAVLSHIGAKTIFDSSFDCLKANQPKMNALLLVYFNSSLTSADSLIIADLGNEVMNYIIAILLEQQPLIEQIKECIKSFTLKLHGKQLKLIFEELLKLLKAKDETQEYHLKTGIVVFQVFNTILSVIKDLFIKNYFIKYKDVLIQLLNTSNAFIFKRSTAPAKLGQKSKRNDFNEDDSAFSYYKLSCLLLDNIKMNFRFSRGELLAETTEELYEPVLNQLKLSDSLNEIAVYYDEAVKGCLYEMFKNSKSDELLGKFNEDLLELLREDNYVTRLLVLKTVLHLLESLKERYISFIEEIIQCVSERLEDSNDKVQSVARDVIKCVEKLTGENYATYLE